MGALTVNNKWLLYTHPRSGRLISAAVWDSNVIPTTKYKAIVYNNVLPKGVLDDPHSYEVRVLVKDTRFHKHPISDAAREELKNTAKEILILEKFNSFCKKQHDDFFPNQIDVVTNLWVAQEIVEVTAGSDPGLLLSKKLEQLPNYDLDDVIQCELIRQQDIKNRLIFVQDIKQKIEELIDLGEYDKARYLIHSKMG